MYDFAAAFDCSSIHAQIKYAVQDMHHKKLGPCWCSLVFQYIEHSLLSLTPPEVGMGLGLYDQYEGILT